MPRKTRFGSRRVARRLRASMRPRPDAAENIRAGSPACRRRRCFNEAAARCRGKPGTGRVREGRCSVASMRPRPDAAENDYGWRALDWEFCASMRPRPDAAENLPLRPSLGVDAGVASMRPRPDAAENARRCRPLRSHAHRFNEAAARCRGKRVAASRGRGGVGGFNEAAARCRGKRSGPRPDPGAVGCFNEAAARCRGKPGATRGR